MLSHLVVGQGLYYGDSIFYAVCFLLLMWIIKVLAWKPVTKMMQDRADKISNDIDSAEKSRNDAAELVQKRQAALASSRSEAQKIVNDAKANGQQQREQIVTQAQADVQTLKQNAQKDIEQERQDALSNARNDVADLSIEIASKIIQRELKADDQKALIDSYIEGLGKQHES
ncbi:F0F1 ATP synthase subunit B [Levilactobacillus brevis]|uniref:ATP synthase subunit b n=2 Tax=Levilactobacillus brevis TaxID=1580 RepID=A0AB38X4X1_LEVBR|nr:F0F1 ATP synthase subunit B [Levilactobacillus brevis]MCM6798904.1 F0F1 ATP synthase subunit B [Levilactobacillus brevis]MCM6802400.1 F0F1 ATP synthase subunit B [Levilactobacillus brevis]MCM6805628.1 F0F1 ATP synthase subunit B [Levilactobacillus brevis]MCM6806932.1 F0F1 ATP synthase subunit B [Levilactobacillus brevis]MCM6812827.1 F0F1 ATP synthase subunit B [Levilactobacillus brevis]